MDLANCPNRNSPTDSGEEAEIFTKTLSKPPINARPSSPNASIPNLTGSATIEDDAGRVFSLTAGSTEELLRLVGAYLMLLGITSGIRLEILGDGAK